MILLLSAVPVVATVGQLFLFSIGTIMSVYLSVIYAPYHENDDDDDDDDEDTLIHMVYQKETIMNNVPTWNISCGPKTMSRCCLP